MLPEVNTAAAKWSFTSPSRNLAASREVTIQITYQKQTNKNHQNKNRPKPWSLKQQEQRHVGTRMCPRAILGLLAMSTRGAACLFDAPLYLLTPAHCGLLPTRQTSRAWPHLGVFAFACPSP